MPTSAQRTVMYITKHLDQELKQFTNPWQATWR